MNQSGLAGAVGCPFLDSDNPGLRCDVNDGARYSSVYPVLSDCRGQEEAALEVGVKDGVPVVGCQFQRRFGHVDAGVVQPWDTSSSTVQIFPGP